MLEDLLNSMQNHEDWRGQAMHGHQEAGAAAAATAPVFFSEWAMNVTFQLAMELKSQPTPFEAMGIVDDDLLFTASQYQRLGASLRQRMMERWLREMARRTWPITRWLRQFQAPGPSSESSFIYYKRSPHRPQKVC